MRRGLILLALIAAGVRSGDALLDVNTTNGGTEFLLVTRDGRAIRFPERQVTVVGRTAQGVKGIGLRGDDLVVSALLIRREGTVLAVSDQGWGRRTDVNAADGEGGTPRIRLRRCGPSGVRQVARRRGGGRVDAHVHPPACREPGRPRARPRAGRSGPAPYGGEPPMTPTAGRRPPRPRSRTTAGVLILVATLWTLAILTVVAAYVANVVESDVERAIAARQALEIAAEICVYTNREITVLELSGSDDSNGNEP